MSTDTLETRAAELREIVNTPTEKERAVRELAEVEQKLADQRKQEALDGAKARMLAIKRGHGSLRNEYGEDAERVRAITGELNAAVDKMNARYVSLVDLEDEARRLSKTYGVPLPEFGSLKSLDRVQPPAETLGAVEPARLFDHTDVARIARAAAAGRAQEDIAAQKQTKVQVSAEDTRLLQREAVATTKRRGRLG